jgi:hypothetical protein
MVDSFAKVYGDAFLVMMPTISGPHKVRNTLATA